MTKFKMLSLTALMFTSLTVGAAPFGGEDDVNYAKQLWNSMSSASYVGDNSIMSTPYTGQHPHGAVLDTIEGPVLMGNKLHHVIIKRNYGGEGVSKMAVANNPAKYLKAVTVMLKREGYDPENNDWFWVKYKADGSLDKNPKGMQLAGRVAKGMPVGCIACHKAATGGDMIFNHD